MTERKEIERLLQMTGRTLEGLPKEHSSEERYRELSTWMPWGEKMCHQSDVIELLVGALREALDKPMQKPMTLEELTKSVFQIPCWIEVIGRDLQPDVIDRDIAGMFSKLATHGFTLYYDPETYEKVWRAWASRPTDEERKAATWKT